MDFLIKAARDLLGMTQDELCRKAGVPLITLRRIEGRPDHKGLVSQENVEKVIEALRQEGVQFLSKGQMAENGGVALRSIDYEAVKRQNYSDWKSATNETAVINALRNLWIYNPQGNGKDLIWVACDMEQLVKIGEAVFDGERWKYRTKKIIFNDT